MTAIYHITHITNLRSVFAQGGLCCDKRRTRDGLECRGIAFEHIKERRARRPVPRGPRGTLADYVPFYFAPRSPMLYTIDRGNVPSYLEGQLPIVHLVASAENVQHSELPFVFTDGHADMDYSDFFADLEELENVDWDLMKEVYWHDTPDDGDRKRRRQAEFLVHDFVPWELIEVIGVINREIAAKVSSLLQNQEHRPSVLVRPQWYY